MATPTMKLSKPSVPWSPLVSRPTYNCAVYYWTWTWPGIHKKTPSLFSELTCCISHAEYLVRNPVHSALWSCRRQKFIKTKPNKKHYFWPSRILITEAFMDLFKLYSKSTLDKLMDNKIIDFEDNFVVLWKCKGSPHNILWMMFSSYMPSV